MAELGAELMAFLRAVQPTNNMALTRLEERYSEEGFPAAPSGRINFMCPSYGGVPWMRRLKGRPQVRVFYFLNRLLLRVVV